MKKKKSTLLVPKFVPADEATLTHTWLCNADVMLYLKCSLNTVKKLRLKKLLPFSKLEGRVYFNLTDVQNMLVIARRLSL